MSKLLTIDNGQFLSPTSSNGSSNEHYKIIQASQQGFPSLWLPSSPEDLEKISLGILLRKGHLDTINLVGFNECCFSNVGIEVSKVEDTNFPIPTVGHLHYELCTTDDLELTAAIELFLKCNGDFADFVKSDPNKNNMRKIAAKYINEVSEQYQQKVKEWAKE